MNQLGNFSSELIVSEQFGPTLQGEGMTQGLPAYFLRLTACNLSCGRKSVAEKHDGTRLENATWVCDTIEVFRKGDKLTTDRVIENFGDMFIYDMKMDRCHLVITGGEPMLQQNSIVQLIHRITQLCGGTMPHVEVETNGTIMPTFEMINSVTQWNVSPKLSNSGMREHKRIFPKVLERLSMCNSCFKFVVERAVDIKEIAVYFLPHIDESTVYLMPAASERKHLEDLSVWVAAQCLRKRWKFSNRLQIQVWDKKTGV